MSPEGKPLVFFEIAKGKCRGKRELNRTQGVDCYNSSGESDPTHLQSHHRLFRFRTPRRRMNDSIGGNSCPICLDGLESRSASIILPCTHAYCIRCIRQWSDIKCKCPLCNSDFRSWLCRYNNAGYREEVVSPSGRSQHVGSHRRDEALRRRRNQFFERRRIIRRSRDYSVVKTQARVFPTQRSFGQPGDDSPAVVAERRRQWRASIYYRRLRAVIPPFKQPILCNIGENETVLKRIGPWIKRELQALLDDPDPTVIVHVVVSLFITRFEKCENLQDRLAGEYGHFLAPLRPFLHDQTEAFWHELICFSKSQLSMEAYDTLVMYEELD